MNISTAHNHLRRLTGLASDIYSSARYGAFTHEQILASLQARVYSDPAHNKLPGWASSTLHERIQRMATDLYYPCLTASELDHALALAREGKEVSPARYIRWALRVDGVERTSNDICAMRAAGDDGVWERVEGAHVWNHRPDKAFSPWALTGVARIMR